MRKKKITEMVCVLDRSGSMYGKEKAAVNSYNAMLRKQKELEGMACITTALFSDRCDILYAHTPIGKARELTEKEYYTGGNTALFDALGKVFLQVDEVLGDREEEYEEKVLLFVITDGMENASVDYGQKEIRGRILEKEKKGWKVLFFGTDMEILNLAKNSGVPGENTIYYSNDPEGIAGGYEMAGACFSQMRDEKKPQETNFPKQDLY